jgi:uncharacterized membrane protein
MNNEEKKVLPTQDEIYRLVQENNRMLKAMRRGAFVGALFKFVWWILILIIIPYVIYVLCLQPYVESLMNAYQNVEATTQSVNERLDSIPDVTRFFEQFGGGQ